MSRKAQLHTGIYVIENLQNGRRYVGSAMRFSKRWKEHQRGLARGNHHSRFLQRDWNKRGSEAFQFRVALFCKPEDLLFYEQALIDFYKPEYNTAPIAGSQLGFRHSDETKIKMAEAARRTKNFTGKTHSAESNERNAAAHRGIIQHQECIDKREATIRQRYSVRPAKRLFTEYDVRLIRERGGVRGQQVKLAQFYRVCTSVISEIVTRKAYSWVV